jgi:hypothetical protein
LLTPTNRAFLTRDILDSERSEVAVVRTPIDEVVGDLVREEPSWVGVLWATCQVARTYPEWFDASFVRQWLIDSGEPERLAFSLTHLLKLGLVNKLPKEGGGRVYYTMPRRAEVERALAKLGLSSWPEVQALMMAGPRRYRGIAHFLGDHAGTIQPGTRLWTRRAKSPENGMDVYAGDRKVALLVLAPEEGDTHEKLQEQLPKLYSSGGSR